MIYENIIEGKFIKRLNRFTARCQINDKEEWVHVKNTGRCRELLLPEVRVWLQKADKKDRKTKYDLITVYKEGIGCVNIDSQVPNKLVSEWLKTQDYDLVKPEFSYGKSRIDFYMEKGQEKYLLEVKGCTLEENGIGYFPDAPTVRGLKHLRELTKAALEGYHCSVAFVIAMENIKIVRPNTKMQPEFSEELAKAQKAGVEILYMR